MTPVLRRVSTVEVRRVTWRAPGRLALGKLSVMDGDPGLGKSTIAADWAARVTRGDAILGGDPFPAQGVLFISDEDDPHDTIRPRLEVAGADLDLVYLMSFRDSGGVEHIPEFPRDGFGLLDAMIQAKVGLVVIDPLMLYMGAEINTNRDADIRRALAPVIKAAHVTNACVLVLRHLTKGGGPNALYRGGGSIGIIGAARIGMLVARDPDDESGRTGVLASTKINVGVPAPSLSYQLDSVAGSDVARVRWLGESKHQAGTLLDAGGTDQERGERNDAESFLLQSLEEGPCEVRDIKRMANEAGVSWRSIERAKQHVPIQSDKVGFGRGARWEWRLTKTATIDRQRPPTSEDPKNGIDMPDSIKDRQRPPTVTVFGRGAHEGREER